MRSLSIIRLLIFAALFGVMVWDAMLWLNRRGVFIPEGHKELLLTGVLVWIALVFFGENSDDDWVQEY